MPRKILLASCLKFYTRDLSVVSLKYLARKRAKREIGC